MPHEQNLFYILTGKNTKTQKNCEIKLRQKHTHTIKHIYRHIIILCPHPQEQHDLKL